MKTKHSHLYIYTFLLAAALIAACKKDDHSAETVYMPDAGKGIVKREFAIADTPFIVSYSAVMTGTDYATVSCINAAN